MKVSVIVPYYNSLKTIERTLDSILRQTYIDFEVILVNDCSMDDPTEVISRYIVLFDERKIHLRYIKLDQNAGPSKARNIGWTEAKGEFLAFLDSDDIWHPKKLEICSKFFVEKLDIMVHDCVVLQSTRSIDDNISFYQTQLFTSRKMYKLEWLIKNQAVTPSVIVRRDIALRFDESMKYSEDYDLWLRIVFQAGSVIKVLGLPLTFLGKQPMQGESLSGNVLKMRVGEIELFVNFCTRNPRYLPLLPILVVYSFFKHWKLLLSLWISSSKNER
jgi:teichuronic acid biosynthesis glycosyltransferase TuaG